MQISKKIAYRNIFIFLKQPPELQPLWHKQICQNIRNKPYLGILTYVVIFCTFKATDLEKRAVDHSGHQLHLLLSHSCSDSLESRGRDVNAVLFSGTRFSLNTIKNDGNYSFIQVYYYYFF